MTQDAERRLEGGVAAGWKPALRIAMLRIHLVRHGRSPHVHAGWIDLAGFHRWRESYEAAAIVANETSPAALLDLAKTARVIAASDAPRAIASAKLLRDDVVVTPLLRELELRPPNLRGVKLPLALWALAFGVRWLFRRTHATPAEQARAREAAEWLERQSTTVYHCLVCTSDNPHNEPLAEYIARSGGATFIPVVIVPGINEVLYPNLEEKVGVLKPRVEYLQYLLGERRETVNMHRPTIQAMWISAAVVLMLLVAVVFSFVT